MNTILKPGLAVLGIVALAVVAVSQRPAAASHEPAGAREDLHAAPADTHGALPQISDDAGAARDGERGSAGPFRGYDCTVDCSGHEAGYQWAEQHDITDEADCEGKSSSFEEGCLAYVEGQDTDEPDTADEGQE